MDLFSHQRKSNAPGLSRPLKELTHMMGVAQFLADPKRHPVLDKIKELIYFEPARYDSLCHPLVKNLIEYCQNLPATANSFYSHAGGLVDYALNRTEAALTIFQQFVGNEQGEVLSEEQRLWQYALFSAALLRGIGKLYSDYRVNLFDNKGHLLKLWNPLEEPLHHTGSYYDYEFHKEADPDFHPRLNIFLAKLLMPSSGIVWISSNRQVLMVWLALLNEDERTAGTLGAILIRAEAIAIQRYLNHLIGKHSTNSLGPYGKAGTFSGGADSLLVREQSIGAEFIQWLKQSLASGLIVMNKAPLFIVPGGLLMSKEVFELFVREHSEYKNWQAVQNAFLSLGLQQQQGQRTANKSGHSGFVLTNYEFLLPDSFQIDQDKKTTTTSAVNHILKNQTKVSGDVHSSVNQELVNRLTPGVRPHG